MAKINDSSLDFISQLKKNNNRDWFNKNKPLYIKEHELIISFAESVINKMRSHDNIETINGKKSLHRIYRDTRFSKDKTPYKNHWSGGFKRATPALRGGYYFHIEPGNSFAAGGFWGPNTEDLKRIRQEITVNPMDFTDIITSKNFRKNFGELIGEKLKTAPKGYPRDHPQIELLRHKQFLLKKSFTDKQITSLKFSDDLNQTFKEMRPFFDLMSEILTTNTNGESIIKS